MAASAPVGWSVAVDREQCIGSGICVVYAPDFFTHDDEAKAMVVGEADGADQAAVRTAVEACPTSALALLAGDKKEA
ncbi:MULTISPECIES: ferredoxin [unclassified Pseudofrankia]|uniref:ferredoxin n=1 Tax=unclassified Pseudofrankia TaxID=2994372 RepID=UPI0008D91898|nr:MULTISPECIES: ferredoxin [unclassified Pseudofrankia]MDT3439104.1 ferredoxin [Pseudofrankia sp. BMG5.37]OHV45761.1 ferredoxin [Pseudofrankia sp. BMG5.36]